MEKSSLTLFFESTHQWLKRNGVDLKYMKIGRM
jgi:hypothetical protein